MLLSRRINTFKSTALMSRYFSHCPTKEWTFGMIRPDGMKHLGPIFNRIHEEGFEIRRLKMTRFSKATAKTLYEEILLRSFYPQFADYVTSGPIVAFRLRRLNAIDHWRNVMGPTDSAEAKITHPETLRGMFGKDLCQNVVHGAENQDQVIKATNLFFGNQSIFGREKAIFPNALFVLTQGFIDGGKLGLFFEKARESGLFLNTMRMYDVDEVKAMSPKISENIAETMSKEGSRGRKVLMVEFSHPKGYLSLHEGVIRIQTFCDVSQFSLVKEPIKTNANLFI